MLLQEAPMDTLNFMILGYAAILGPIALFILSLYIRTRNLARDQQLLEELDAGEGH